MKLPPPTIDDAVFVRRNVESAIRIGVLAFLVVWSFRIIRPFFEPVMWGVIIAVAVFPAYSALAARLGNRRKLSAALLVVVAMAALLIPSVHFFGDTVDGIEHVAKRLEAGTLTIPPPSEKVRDWPLIGGDVDEVWQLASTNLKAALNRAWGSWSSSSRSSSPACFWWRPAAGRRPRCASVSASLAMTGPGSWFWQRRLFAAWRSACWGWPPSSQYWADSAWRWRACPVPRCGHC
jgi:hypothetical protein